MKVILIPFGSAGDVHPFLGLGQALRGRGHQVSLLANDHFGDVARHLGLDFVAMGDIAEFQHILADPDLWHPTRALRLVGQSVTALLDRIYQEIEGRFVPGETVVAAGTLAFAARVAQEKLGIPTATVHLQPGILRSVYETPVLPGVDFSGWPRFARRWMYWLADVGFADAAFAPGLNALRTRLSLRPVRRVLDQWVHSPQCVLGLFPSWYGPIQPDWPPQMILSGFPLFDETPAREVPAEAEAFLAAGDPPIVFTPGSAMMHGAVFFRESVAACQILGRRGLLLSRFTEHLPSDLPESVRHFEYIPFSRILPRSAALVHHGGIGTTAQALAAGIPQLIMPMAHDQPDNAARVQRLGVGSWLAPKSYQAGAVAEQLASLIGSAAVAERGRDIAQRIRDEKPLDVACRALEALADTPAPLGV